ncbi:hypothetical protein AN960_21015 [Bacillus sp. FJAT-25509]|uniref:SLATT domain-containing protein n=1 Tax=Bacillus sp. FJAT-25509 TaxID=1712029 RepID=UPI0007018C69|nr:SLATT domain-containing protein [Bacillus sp. FJAT-25509]KQL33555.1 hypothetical protein AN960_21015 [Bacillus sp. FJAT-25509]
MNEQKQLSYLIKEVNVNMEFFEQRREQNKKKAFRLKFSSILASALITVLLGLKTFHNDVLTDFTLVLAALITVFNGVEGFYNHKGLWTKDVRTLGELRGLKRDLEFLSVGGINEGLSNELLTNYLERLQNISNEDVSMWFSLRDEQNTSEISS